MASPLKAARDRIATRWGALTPPSDPGRTYHRLRGRTFLDGASGHRTFWFEPPNQGTVEDFSRSLLPLRHQFVGQVRLSTAGTGIDEAFSAIADEAVLLIGAVNLDPGNYPAGVQYLQALGYRVHALDSGDLVLAITFDCITEEADGA